MSNISNKFCNALKESGIGLLVFDDSVEEVIREVIPAAKEPANIPVFREMLIKNLEKVTY